MAQFTAQVSLSPDQHSILALLGCSIKVTWITIEMLKFPHDRQFSTFRRTPTLETGSLRKINERFLYIGMDAGNTLPGLDDNPQSVRGK